MVMFKCARYNGALLPVLRKGNEDSDEGAKNHLNKSSVLNLNDKLLNDKFNDH